MSDTKAYDNTRIDAAVQQFESIELTPAEALLASAKLLQNSLRHFREDASRFRGEMGEQVTHQFARQELNDLIYDLQDSIAPALKTYNSLLRDPAQKGEGPPG